MPGPLRPARFVARPNQFVVRVAIDPSQEEVLAHLPDPGRLTELLVPGAQVFVRKVEDDRRSTQWSAVLVQTNEGQLVSVDTGLPNILVQHALEQEAIEELEGWSVVRSEVPIGRSRFDFMLERLTGKQMILEIKGVSLVVNDVAMFPDAPSERAVRHVRELTRIATETDIAATLFFVVQRNDVDQLMPAKHIDPAFAQALAEAKMAGVRLMARRCQITLAEIVLGKSVKVRSLLKSTEDLIE